MHSISQKVLELECSNLHHRCILWGAWTSSVWVDLDLFFKVMGSVVWTWIFGSWVSNWYCIYIVTRSGEFFCIWWPWPWPIFSRSTFNLELKSCAQDISESIRDRMFKLTPQMHLRRGLDEFSMGWPWPIFQGHGVSCLNMNFWMQEFQTDIAYT